MPWALILDGLLAVLLLMMIGYAFVLNRRLATLRTDREDLEAFISRFNEATSKANASLQGLRAAAESNASMIKSAADKAQALRDELAFLVERADGSAERLAKTSGRPEGQAPADKQSSAAKSQSAGAGVEPKAQKPAARQSERRKPEAEPDAGAEAASEAERELMNALRRAR
jgi:chromosome segregation ATPase